MDCSDNCGVDDGNGGVNKIDSGCGEKSTHMDCSGEDIQDTKDSELGQNNGDVENKESSQCDNDMEGVECSKTDENSDEVKCESKMDTSFNVRNSTNLKYNIIWYILNLYLLAFFVRNVKFIIFFISVGGFTR